MSKHTVKRAINPDHKQWKLYATIVDYYEQNERMPTYQEMIKMGNDFVHPTRCVFNALAQLCKAGALIRVKDRSTSRYAYLLPGTPEAAGIDVFYQQEYKPKGVPTSSPVQYHRSATSTVWIPFKPGTPEYRKAMQEIADYGY